MESGLQLRLLLSHQRRRRLDVPFTQNTHNILFSCDSGFYYTSQLIFLMASFFDGLSPAAPLTSQQLTPSHKALSGSVTQHAAIPSLRVKTVVYHAVEIKVHSCAFSSVINSAQSTKPDGRYRGIYRLSYALYALPR